MKNPINLLNECNSYNRCQKLKYFTFLYVQVTHNSHRYLKEVEMREEGGTPAIVESIRAGLVFQLKEVSLIYYTMMLTFPYYILG